MIQAHLLWSLARLRVPLPQPWLRAWMAASRKVLSSYNAQDLCMALWALAELRHSPGEGWSQAAIDCAAVQVPGMEARALAVTLWALAVLRIAPPPLFMDAALQRAEQLMLQAAQAAEDSPR